MDINGPHPAERRAVLVVRSWRGKYDVTKPLGPGFGVLGHLPQGK